MAHLPGRNVRLDEPSGNFRRCVKRIVVPPERTHELEDRASDINLYCRMLREHGLQVPAADIVVDKPQSQIVISMDWVAGPTAFAGLKEGAGDRAAIVQLLTQAMMRTAISMSSERGIGYDSALENFILAADGSGVHLVDITPPRLMFRLLPNGRTAKIPYDLLLVDYPEKSRLSPAHEAMIRRYYYTPLGTIEHLLAWCITAVVCDHADAASSWRRMAGTKLVRDAALSVVESEKTLSTALEAGLNSPAFAAFMARRIARAQGLPVQ